MTPLLTGIFASQISGHLYGGPTGAFDALATVTVPSGGLTSVTFANIPAGYTHLQIRAATGTATYDSNAGYVYFNGDTTAANYNDHSMYANGSGIGAYYTSSNMGMIYLGKSPYYFNSAIIDILDYTNTNKYKTAKSIFGYEANGTLTSYVGAVSGLWRNTSTINSIQIVAGGSGNFAQNSSFALYGVK